MKTIICILLWLNVSGQTDSPFVATWNTNNEIGVLRYEVQSSINKVNWNISNTISPKKKAYNSYAVTLQKNPVWYRINSVMSGNTSFTTGAVKFDTSFNISSITVKTRVVSFQSDNELNLSYYIIWQSLGGILYTEFQRITAKGNSKYISNRLANKQQFIRISVTFKNGSSKILDTRKI